MEILSLYAWRRSVISSENGYWAMFCDAVADATFTFESRLEDGMWWDGYVGIVGLEMELWDYFCDPPILTVSLIVREVVVELWCCCVDICEHEETSVNLFHVFVSIR